MVDAKKCDVCKGYYDSADNPESIYDTNFLQDLGGNNNSVYFKITPVRRRSLYDTEHFDVDLCKTCFCEGIRYIINNYEF